MSTAIETYKAKHPIRVVTATSLFDGHDAAINIMRRILQDTGAEVIHLGHNRSVAEIVNAAIEEDVQGIAISSYQGGHMEFFKYMRDMLAEKNAGHIKIFGGGGGVIVPDEIHELEEYGITKIYSPADGSKMGLQGMINHMMSEMDFSTVEPGSLDAWTGKTPLPSPGPFRPLNWPWLKTTGKSRPCASRSRQRSLTGKFPLSG
jgi:methylmalonyl-CoA mutase